MRDITVVNLNPCLDWTWHIGDFTHGGTNRVQSSRSDAAGKGINVAMALKNLGASPLCLGFNFRENGNKITEKLDANHIKHDFITAEGALRVNIKLYDHTSTMTEINQPGGYVSPALQDALFQKILAHNKKEGILVLSGSYPAGITPDFYARLCEAWQGEVAVDAFGEALRLAVESKNPPHFIKPNLDELEKTFNVKLTTQAEIDAFCREQLVEKGVNAVCVSMGAEGALMVSKISSEFAPAFPLEIKSLQGAGDAMVAGFVYAMATGHNRLQYAMAAAAATITKEGTLMCDREGFERILKTQPHSPPHASVT